jgi:hypothetical protein
MVDVLLKLSASHRWEEFPHVARSSSLLFSKKALGHDDDDDDSLQADLKMKRTTFFGNGPLLRET